MRIFSLIFEIYYVLRLFLNFRNNLFNLTNASKGVYFFLPLKFNKDSYIIFIEREQSS